MKRVAVIHPWMPEYRINLFSNLRLKLLESGVELNVFYGEPEMDWRLRNDQRELDFGKLLPTRQIQIFGRTLFLKSLKPLGSLKEYDLIIVEQAVRNLETYLLLAKRAPIAFWGHGKTYTQESIPMLEKLKSWLTMKGSWFFSYTAQGAENVISDGFPEDRVTVLNNTIDTASLSKNLESQDSVKVLEYRQNELAGAEQVALYIGALDKSKKIPFLIRSLDLVAAKEPGFRLLIAGDGPERQEILREISSRPWARFLGTQFGEQKAFFLRVADVLTIPGRAGLVVIDGFCAGLPIITTTDPHHPPEFEYLLNGTNSLITRESESEYSNGVLEALLRPLNERLQSGAKLSSTKYSIESLVSNFNSGVMKYLNENKTK